MAYEEPSRTQSKAPPDITESSRGWCLLNQVKHQKLKELPDGQSTLKNMSAVITEWLRPRSIRDLSGQLEGPKDIKRLVEEYYGTKQCVSTDWSARSAPKGTVWPILVYEQTNEGDVAVSNAMLAGNHTAKELSGILTDCDNLGFTAVLAEYKKNSLTEQLNLVKWLDKEARTGKRLTTFAASAALTPWDDLLPESEVTLFIFDASQNAQGTGGSKVSQRAQQRPRKTEQREAKVFGRLLCSDQQFTYHYKPPVGRVSLTEAESV